MKKMRKRIRLALYENGKKKLAAAGLSAAEYEAAIKALAKKWRV